MTSQAIKRYFALLQIIGSKKLRKLNTEKHSRDKWETFGTFCYSYKEFYYNF